MPAAAQAQLAELKKHLATLERSTTAGTAVAGAAGKAVRSAVPWATQVAAADSIFATLLADSRTTGTAGASSTNEPRPTGTAGTASAKVASSVALDEATKAKLTSARASLTAFAAAMSGTSSSPKPSTDSASTAPAHAVEPSSTATAPVTSPTPAAPAPAAPAPAAPDPAAPAPAPSAPVTPSPDPAVPQTAPPASQSAGVEQTAGKTPPEAGAQPTVDEQAAKRALTSARENLAQLTQLPGAAQLTGEARTQVSQLIANFNELITATTGWRASYAKVDANLTALVGPAMGGEPAATAAAPATGTAGAVGTSGTATTNIDPEVKAKLIELRRNLKAFEQAAGSSAPK